jgi:Protein of unknown function (DUF3631)
LAARVLREASECSEKLLLRDLYNFAEQQLRLKLANRPSVILHNKRQNRDFIVTDDLLKAMWALSESPWRAWGKGRRMLNAEELYWLLRDYGIDGSERLGKTHSDLRGLYVDTIFKAFERYRHTKDASSSISSGEPAGSQSIELPIGASRIFPRLNTTT